MNTQPKTQREQLKQALKQLHEAKPEDLQSAKKEAAKYFKGADAKELALAEQELIQEGMPHSEMKRLCDVHLEVMKEQLGAQAAPSKDLPPSHPISICVDEHDVIKDNLKKLKSTFEKLKAADSFESSVSQVNTLKELSHFFLETEKHHKREEEAIFPRLEAHGITEPPAIFKQDHVEFLAKKKELYDNMMSAKSDFKTFVATITPAIDFLTDNLEDHIFKEDNILYPIALSMFTDEEWTAVRKKFDAIGYCCFAPADLNKENKE